MSSRLLNTLLLVAFFVSLGLIWLLDRDYARPNFAIMSGMVESVSYGAYAANPSFADGKTLRTPSAGTIPRDQLPLHFSATPEDAVRAGEELRNPLSAADATVRQHGQFIYSNFCQVCHGAQGKGDGPVSQRGVPPPPSLLNGKSKDMKDGQLFHILTFGQGNMPSYAAQLSREERWQVIAFVRSLQQATSAGEEKKP